MKGIIMFASISLMVIIFSSSAYNQPLNGDDQKSLSDQDSVLYKRYKEGFKNSYLYSNDHQLYLDSLLMLMPHHAWYWQQKAMPLFKMKKYEIGMVFLDSAVKYDANEWLDYRAFIKCIFQKSYADAISDFETIRKQKGYSFVMDHSYDFYMGLSYLQLNKFELADSLIQNSITWSETRNKHGHYLEYFYSGVVKMEKKQYDIAIKLFDTSLSIYPNFPDAKYYKALCLSNFGKNKEAQSVMTEALNDLNKGYINNEDNSFYEDYPYQHRKLNYEMMLKYYNSKL